MTDELHDTVESMLSPWHAALGADRQAYTNHVLRVLEFCDGLHAVSNSAGPVPSNDRNYLAAAVFHDLGIWTAGTFDYLAPSAALARQWLQDADATPDSVSTVVDMIEQHHKLRSAGDANSPVEILRRADAIDVMFGLRRFGLPYQAYRDIRRRRPDHGFHRRLVQLTATRTRTHPLSPLPMMRW